MTEIPMTMTLPAGDMTAGPTNGLNLDALAEAMRQIEADPAKGKVGFQVKSAWMGQTRSRATVIPTRWAARKSIGVSRST
jgi:hypothetical protein